MSSDDEQPHAFVTPIPSQVIEAVMGQHDRAHARQEDRHNAAMRWLDGLDAEGLMALRYILRSDADEAYGNNRWFDGMVWQLLRARGLDPRTGVDPAAQLLENTPPG